MGQGFGPEAPMVEFKDVAIFLVGSDITPVATRINEYIAYLTTWVPKTQSLGIITRDPITVTGKDYADAYRNVNLNLLSNNWGDGFPVVPATQDRVDWILTGSDNKPSDLVGKGAISPKGGLLDIQTLATIIAMTGGRPEYMPVLESVFQTLTNTDISFPQTTSSRPFHIAIVNGPMAQQIRLASQWGMLGPDPNYPAGTCIGRAFRSVLQNVGGTVPGFGGIPQYGYVTHVGMCFSEDEVGLPTGWQTYAEEYYKRPAGTNSCTAGFIDKVKPFTHRGSGSEPSFQIEMTESFCRTAAVMKEVGGTVPATAGTAGTKGVLMFNSTICNNLVGLGYTKASIKKTLADHLFVTPQDVMYREDVQRDAANKKIDLATLPAKIPLYTDPQQINLVCAGGHHPTAALWVSNLNYYGNSAIVLPKSWDNLLAQAEKDLGQIPEPIV
jgi:hypothetical protein